MKEVFKSFDGVTALQGLSFEVQEGSIFGLLGRNGAGKTTALRILGTVLEPDSGHCEVAGFDTVRDSLEVRERIGVLPEHYAQTRRGWTVLQYLKYFSRLAGLSSEEGERCIEVLERVGLVGTEDRRLGTLSSGMRKRVEIARLMLKEPRVLLLDEPGKELDILAKQDIWMLLLNYAKRGATIVISSHDPAEVATLCHSVCVLREGRKTYEGEPLIPERSGIQIPSAVFGKLEGELGRCPVKVTIENLGEWTLLSPEEGVSLGRLLEWLSGQGVEERFIRLSHVGGLAQYL
jgi:ABC-type multidrug transport system ATPase subunit